MIGTVYRLTWRQLATVPRLVALVALGLVGVLVGLAIGIGNVTDRLDAGTSLVNSFGLSLFAPVVTLVFASAAFGDPTEDGSLVYLWLRPVPRWQIVLGAWLAAVTVAAPVVVAVLALAAALSRGGTALVTGTVVSSVVAVLAYSALFTLLGLVVRRALVWGLAYVLLWEGFVALAGATAAKLALRSYTRSILAGATGRPLRLATVSSPWTVVVPCAVAAAALALATARLARTEVA